MELELVRAEECTSIFSKISYWFKKQWYGECDDCKVLLQEVKGWARSDCPKCGKHYHWSI